MIQYGPKCSKMLNNGPKWFNMVKNAPKYSEILQDAQNTLKFSKMLQNASKMLEMVHNIMCIYILNYRNYNTYMNNIGANPTLSSAISTEFSACITSADVGWKFHPRLCQEINLKKFFSYLGTPKYTCYQRMSFC